MNETNDATKMFVTIPVTMWGQIVFAAQETDDARMKALIDQAIAAAGQVKTTMWQQVP
jgi:hypothetical protein